MTVEIAQLRTIDIVAIDGDVPSHFAIDRFDVTFDGSIFTITSRKTGQRRRVPLSYVAWWEPVIDLTEPEPTPEPAAAKKK